MDEKELDSLLNRSKSEARAFFGKINLSAARQAVKARVASGVRKPKAPWPVSLKTGLAAVCLACVAFIAVFIAGSVQDSPKVAAGDALSQQSVSLGGGDGLLSYFPVNSPQRSDKSLMSVLWDVGGGNSKMLYNTLFEKCDEPYPASTLAVPGADGAVLLIYSGDSAGSFIDYRLVQYTAGDLSELLSKDYVPNGSVHVENDVVVENRYDIQNEANLVSYIVPYRPLFGEILLPVQTLSLKVGEQIMLVGVAAPLDVYSKGGLVEQVGGQTGEPPVYMATGAGSDVLLLQRGSDCGYLNLQIAGE